MPRIFIAIRFDDAFTHALVGLQNSLKSRGVHGNYCPPGNLHLTLAFIGERCNLAAVRQAVRQVVFQPFTLSLGHLGSFPTRSGVIWCGVQDAAPVVALAAQLRQHLAALGVSFSRTEFYPHVSLVQHPSDFVSDVAIPQASILVGQIFIMKSERIDGELVYSELSADD